MLQQLEASSEINCILLLCQAFTYSCINRHVKKQQLIGVIAMYFQKLMATQETHSAMLSQEKMNLCIVCYSSQIRSFVHMKHDCESHACLLTADPQLFQQANRSLLHCVCLIFNSLLVGTLYAAFHLWVIVSKGLCRSSDGSSSPSPSLPVGSAQSAFKRSPTSSIPEFPLHCEGVDRARFAYAIYLLNKVRAACGSLCRAACNIHL